MSGRTGTDWRALRERLERARVALERTFEPDLDRIDQVLRARAARLAVRGDPAAPREKLQVLVFTVGGQRYGLELARLREVTVRPQVAIVPGAPPRLAGVLQVRGEIHPVWNLARILGLPDPPPPGCVLLLRREPRDPGLLVSTVEGVRALDAGEYQPAAAGMPHLRWITSDAVSILDPDGLWKKDSS